MTAVTEWPWQASTVGSQFEIQLGKMLDAARNFGDPKLYLGNRAVQWGRIDLSAARVVPLTPRDQVRFRLKMNDLLVCEGGEVGRAAIWREQLPECYYQKALHRLRPRSDYDPRVMLAMLEYWSSTNGFANFTTQTSIAHLPRDKFVMMPVPMISRPEQDRLGEVLDDLVSLISTLEVMVAKKKAIMQGVMQQLMAGNTRLPGFSGKQADVVPLGSITTWLSGGTPSRSNDSYWAGSIPWISATSLKGTRIYDSDQRVTAEAVRAGSNMAPCGATLVLVRGMALHREVRAGLALRPVSFNQDVKALIPGPSILREYLTYAVHAKRGEILKLVSSAGSGTGVLDTGLLKRLSIWLPDLGEQEAIASTIRDADAEIDALLQRLRKSNAIKQGMIQELLTGRTRLFVEKERYE